MVPRGGGDRADEDTQPAFVLENKNSYFPQAHPPCVNSFKMKFEPGHVSEMKEREPRRIASQHEQVLRAL